MAAVPSGCAAGVASRSFWCVAVSCRSLATACGWSPNTYKELPMRRSVCAFFVLLAGAGLASVASAQETGTPVFKAPYRAFQSHEFGANLSFPEGPADFGLEGFYTYGYNRFDIGLRGGIVS